MPWTVRQLADAAGVTKKTARDRLKREGLWEWHVTKRADGSLVVDDEAAQAVLARYAVKVKAADAPARDGQAEAMPDYESMIADLRSDLRDARAERDCLREQVGKLVTRVADQADAIRSLPAPDAVERAREDGEHGGRESGEAEGRMQEREKIAMMGFWARRRYLRRDRRDDG